MYVCALFALAVTGIGVGASWFELAGAVSPEVYEALFGPGGAREAAVWAERHADARRRWLDHVAPEAARLDAAIGPRHDDLEQAVSSHR